MTDIQLDLQLMENLNERQRRLYAATQALKYGYGGIKKVHIELGLNPRTIIKGIKDLQSKPLVNRVRQFGGGRKKTVHQHPELPLVVNKIIKKKGNPTKHLIYTHLSIVKLTKEVRQKGYDIGKNVMHRILWGLGFSLQANKKELHKKTHRDCDRQFRYIDRLVDGFLQACNTLSSVLTRRTQRKSVIMQVKGRPGRKKEKQQKLRITILETRIKTKE